MRMQASITTERSGTVVAVLDAEAARVTFACVIFAARFMRRSLHSHGSWSSNCRSRRMEL
jgi:hypothetical protein